MFKYNSLEICHIIVGLLSISGIIYFTIRIKNNHIIESTIEQNFKNITCIDHNIRYFTINNTLYIINNYNITSTCSYDTTKEISIDNLYNVPVNELFIDPFYKYSFIGFLVFFTCAFVVNYMLFFAFMPITITIPRDDISVSIHSLDSINNLEMVDPNQLQHNTL